MKMNILFEFVEGPWGGGNQFLKSLKEALIEMNVYEPKIINADVILFNSHQCLKKVLKAKKVFQRKTFIHRVDGPITLGRPNSLALDRYIFLLNSCLADGTIFQSPWSREKCMSAGMHESKFDTVIINAPKPSIFYTKENDVFHAKKRIIATTWSTNIKKGFDIYQYLDQKLDFEKYEMVLVGNTPVKFSNIKHIPAVPSDSLAEIMRQNDIFITASVDDPCSNSLIEAMHCGLPVIARNSGGHPFIIKNGQGVLFNGKEDILKVIEFVVNNEQNKAKMSNLPDIYEIAKQYYEFCELVVTNVKTSPRTLSRINYAKISLLGNYLNIRKMISWR